jgi:transposase
MATKAIAQSKIKTDKVDAKVLAQLLRCDFVPTVWQPDADTRLRRQVSGRRASRVGQRTQLQNRIHSVLAMRLIIPRGEMSLFGPHGLAWLKSLTEATIDTDGLMMIRSDLRMLEAAEVEILVFDQRLAELGWQDERVKLLMTIPGISIVVAQAVVAAFGDITRFSSLLKKKPAASARTLEAHTFPKTSEPRLRIGFLRVVVQQAVKSADAAASYLGLTPSTRQSDKSVYHGPITKQGNSTARWMLVQAAQHYSRQPGPLGHFFQRLKRRKNHNVAVVATARKLACIAWRILTSGEPYRYAQPAATAQKLASLRIVATGLKRRGGDGKGVKCVAKLEGGSRAVRALDDVYLNEGLPARSALPPGELRHLTDTHTLEFTQSISAPKRVPRNTGTTRSQTRKNTDRLTATNPPEK